MAKGQMRSNREKKKPKKNAKDKKTSATPAPGTTFQATFAPGRKAR
jgi:hypothetical protein